MEASRKQRRRIEIATMDFDFSNIYECIHLVCVAQITIVGEVALMINNDVCVCL